MRNAQQVKWSCIGRCYRSICAGFCFVICISAMKELQAILRKCYFELQYNWFPAWNISFHLGVDGISVAMILFTAFVVIAGVLGFLECNKDDKGILFPAHPTKPWCVWIFYFA